MSAYDLDSSSNARKSNNIETNEQRREGHEEYGGNIQVTDLGQLESWVRGKPEFKYFVYGSTGVLLREFPFGKLRRSHFNGQWVNLHDLIGYWNTSNWGNITYERWIEEDGGTSQALTMGISYTANGVTNTTTINTPAKDRDQNMGTANIQFTDPIYEIPLQDLNGAIYPYYYMNMQREMY